MQSSASVRLKVLRKQWAAMDSVFLSERRRNGGKAWLRWLTLSIFFWYGLPCNTFCCRQSIQWIFQIVELHLAFLKTFYGWMRHIHAGPFTFGPLQHSFRLGVWPITFLYSAGGHQSCTGHQLLIDMSHSCSTNVFVLATQDEDRSPATSCAWAILRRKCLMQTCTPLSGLAWDWL